MQRLHNLDYLRGLAAAGIMIYHYLTWTLGKFDSSTFLGRLGVYGVSIFYVLSGLTLFLVYQEKMLPSVSDVKRFTIKRILRIYPLLWLVTLATLFLKAEELNVTRLLLNLTGLFGFIQWDGSYGTGVWSIGNELVFYVFFPFFILFSKKSRIALILLSLIIFGVYLYFAFSVLDVNATLQSQWRNYVNPLNQVFLFLGGFLIGLVFRKVKLNTLTALMILLVGACLFLFYPANGNQIFLVAGFTRIIFTISCFLICFSFYKMSFRLPTVIHKPLTLLGEASYSVYLLHPIIYMITGTLFSISSLHFYHFPESIRVLTSIFVTLGLSHLVYKYFEKYFMSLGNKQKS